MNNLSILILPVATFLLGFFCGILAEKAVTANRPELNPLRDLAQMATSLADLRLQLADLLSDEDLTDDKLHDASESLLPILHDALQKLEFKARAATINHLK